MVKGYELFCRSGFIIWLVLLLFCFFMFVCDSFIINIPLYINAFSIRVWIEKL